MSAGREPPADAPDDASTTDAVSRDVGYPEELACDVTSTFPRPLHLRPVRRDDAARLVAFHARLSPDSIYRRYFSSRPSLTPREVDHLTRVDYRERLALVILNDDEIVAVCRYERIPASTTGEVAFIVRDDFQHLGLGHILLEHLARAAWARGLTRFSGVTMRENRGMIAIFEHSGYPVTVSHHDEEYYVSFSIDPADRARADARDREPG